MKKLLICADAGKYRLPKDNFANYVAAFTALGAEVALSADPDVAASCDALLLPGGEDVHPARYGQDFNGTIAEFVNEGRDEAEYRAIDLFLAMKKPIIGICRGEQILNIYFGGTMHQDIPDHGRVGTPPWDSVHEVRTVDPLLIRLYGERFPVNSAHHQVIDRLGDGLDAIAWSDEGYVEGIRHRTLPVFAVQWHPERICFAHARPDAVDGSKMLAALLETI